MGEVQATDLTPGDSQISGAAVRSGARAAAPASTPPAPKRKWSARRTLIFIVLASAGLWALIIGLSLR